MDKILILTNNHDIHADYFSTKLEERQIPCVRFNPDSFPLSQKIVWRTASSIEDEVLVLSESQHLFSTKEIGGVWFRKVLISNSHFLDRPENERFARRETEIFFNNLYTAMQNAFWVNNPYHNRFASNKLMQLKLARELGFRVPDTLLTNDYAAAKQFTDKHEESGVIYKSLSSPFISESAEVIRSVYTSRVKITPELAPSIEIAPCLFQECIKKRYELRVTVIGHCVFAARIFSQEHQETKIDWRRSQHLVTSRHEIEKLDSETTQKCQVIVKKLNLVFGAIDLIVKPDGEIVFLEINPNGNWLWLEKLLNLPIADTLADVFCTSQS